MALRSTVLREQVLVFGSFELYRTEKVLRERGRAVRVGGRALDLLIALVERAGEVVSKNELMTHAWPNSIVEDNNLRVHLAAIRKILGDGQGGARYIINVTGRGYSFVAPVTRIDPSPEWVLADPKSLPRLPGTPSRLVGRETAIATLVTQVPRRRLVSVVGPGGVGKTTVAVAVAERLVECYQRVYFVDLSISEGAARVPIAFATALGVSVPAEAPIPGLIDQLREARCLIVLDNCEHVIEKAAELVERIMPEATQVDFIVTSREPLSIHGEFVSQLTPLQTPEDSKALTVEQAARYPAVQLFVERAIDSSESFALTDENAGKVASICRRLDGIPLAIELVAARVAMYGVDALEQGFSYDMLLVAKGRRTAGPRHQSLRSALDWSYSILTPLEQMILRRLAVFRGFFSSESAQAVVGGALSAPVVLETLMSLVAKSLVTTDVSAPNIRFRLLNTTRAYADEMLAANTEKVEMLRRHAEHVRQLLQEAFGQREKLSGQEWFARFASVMEDTRAALDWAFSPSGNVELGIALTVASLPLGLQLSLTNESIDRASQALEALSRLSPPRPELELQMHNAFWGFYISIGATREALLTTIDRAVTLAHSVGNPVKLVAPYTMRVIAHFEHGCFEDALGAAEDLAALAKSSDDPVALVIADRTGAQANHFRGNHGRARVLAERALRSPTPIPLAHGVVDRRVSMRVVLARILFLEGYSRQADRSVHEALDLAHADSPMSVCQVLALAAGPIAFWRGDLQSARKWSRSLQDYTRRHSFMRWHRQALRYVATAQCLSPLPGEPDVVSRVMVLDHERYTMDTSLHETLCTISGDWIDPPTLDRAREGQCGWAQPEILRAGTELEMSQGAIGVDAAESAFQRSIRVARDQGALLWELRAAASLARLWRTQGRYTEAVDMLAAVYGRFTEGHATADLIAAKTLLDLMAQRL